MPIEARWFISWRRSLFYVAIVLLVASFFMNAATGLQLRGAPRHTTLVGWQCMTQTVRSLLHPVGWELLAKHPAALLIFLVLFAHPILLYLPRLDQRTHALLWPMGVAMWGVAAINVMVVAPYVVQQPDTGFYVWTASFALAGVGFFVPPSLGLALGKRGGGQPAQ